MTIRRSRIGNGEYPEVLDLTVASGNVYAPLRLDEGDTTLDFPRGNYVVKIEGIVPSGPVTFLFGLRIT